MQIGAHVRAGGDMLGSLARAHEIGAEVVQVFTQSPRMWKPTVHAAEVLARYRQAQDADPLVCATYCHATYLINLATPDDELWARSCACLESNHRVATGMGAAGLVLHVGSHMGTGFEAAAPRIADALRRCLDRAVGDRDEPCPILLENTAGAGGTVGRSFEELAELIARTDAGHLVGVCLDTQHLWASGIAFGSPAEVEDVLDAIEGTVGLAALGCLHLNDSKAPFGANRDRHANIGEGTIGEKALACLIGHPALDNLAAILEVPGTGKGPRADDVRAAHRVLDAGRGIWAAGAEWTRGPGCRADEEPEGEEER